VHRHYGHAGPAFVEHLLRDIQRIDGWRRTYLQLATEYAKRAGPNPVAGRLAKNLALLELTAQIAAKELAGVLPWSFEEMKEAIESTWSVVSGSAEAADIDRRALKQVLSWAGRHTKWFVNHLEEEVDDERQPFDGWAGRWDLHQGWPWIAFFPDKLQKLLSELGYSPEATLAAWRDRGWMATAKGHHTKQVRVWKRAHYLYVIRRSAVEEVAPSLGECIPEPDDAEEDGDSDYSSGDSANSASS